MLPQRLVWIAHGALLSKCKNTIQLVILIYMQCTIFQMVFQWSDYGEFMKLTEECSEEF